MWVSGSGQGRREVVQVRDRRGAEIVHTLFGANFQQQGRGFYVSLELLAICRGILDRGGTLLESGDEPICYMRRSHDVARRLATGELIPKEKLEQVADGDKTVGTLQALFSSLVVTVPGRRVRPRWFASHLYPFAGELVHYDAVERRALPSVERYVFRDGGGFAYRVLRTDPDLDRRARIRDTLKALVEDGETALGRIASALHSHDEAVEKEFDDDSEFKSVVHDESSPWPNLLRAGVDRIGSRSDVPHAKRVEQILHWVPYCVARHVLRLARNRMGRAGEMVPVDCSRHSNPVRSLGQEKLNEFRWDITKAVVDMAAELRDASSDPASWDKYTRVDSKAAASPKAFFTETMAAVGALNATTGKRHFTFKVPMLEALAAATIDGGREVEFGEYCQWLFDELGIIIGPRQARQVGLTMGIDETDFKTNLDAFRNRLESGGLLTRYSDETDLVHGEIR